MNKILTRLKNKAGETLVESMAGILIFTFGSIIMLSMVTSAADINTATKEADQEYFSQMVQVELAQGGTNGTVIITTPSGTDEVSVSISGTTDGLYAYYAGTAPAAPEGGGN